jgi:hypothetical protein
MQKSFLSKITAKESETEIENHLRRGLFSLFSAKKYIKAIIIGLKTSIKEVEKEGGDATKSLKLASKLQEVLKQFGLEK